MEIFWFEQSLANVPEHNDWLCPRELLTLAKLRFPKRYQEWRLGRWTAKCAVAILRGIPIFPERLAGIEVCTAPSGAPIISNAYLQSPPIISISHRSSRAVCALTEPPTKMGCDLELIESRSDTFLEDYFTFDEQKLVARVPVEDRACVVTLLWSAKESALKALREGLRLDTRSLTVGLEPRRTSNWAALRVAANSGEVFQGWWRQVGRMVQTIVADSPISTPILLQV